MVGIVIVSHSQKIAEGVVELAKQMAASVPMAAAGGLEDGSIGTDFQKIYEAVEAVQSDDGVAILFDLGSAIMTTEMVLESFEGVTNTSVMVAAIGLFGFIGLLICINMVMNGLTYNKVCKLIKMHNRRHH